MALNYTTDVATNKTVGMNHPYFFVLKLEEKKECQTSKQ